MLEYYFNRFVILLIIPNWANHMITKTTGAKYFIRKDHRIKDFSDFIPASFAKLGIFQIQPTNIAINIAPIMRNILFAI